jgi:hypothetical protein
MHNHLISSSFNLNAGNLGKLILRGHELADLLILKQADPRIPSLTRTNGFAKSP